MAEAFKARVIFPNKHLEPLEKWHGDSLLVSETYVGGNVAQLNSGIYRSDLSEKFTLNPLRYKQLVEELDLVFGERTGEKGKMKFQDEQLHRETMDSIDKVVIVKNCIAEVVVQPLHDQESVG